MYYFRSQHYDLGDAQCWVDDNESGAVRLAGYWPKPYNVAVYVPTSLPSHPDLMLMSAAVWRTSTRR